eukprot:TRINITY_DN6701_c7_g1_i1.p1 TRINITY_DN6701_c7_g1~~TRINITY_DN6701_c7_g1_i1.p1  ORF type:complete len:100 (+),score=18.69 TRINITY_DN6701_c7_g1_i1:42-302(+)
MGKWPTYTMNEVRTHNKETDLWVVAHGNVYNPTLFVGHHPGGAGALLKKAGMDVTADFEFHRDRKIWRKYKIGELDTKQQASCGVS